MQQFNFCYSCGGTLTKGEPYDPQQCTSCKMHVFHNSKPCSGVFIFHENKVLLIKRGIEPKYGTWDVPGGFGTVLELPEDIAIREAKEETGLDIKLGQLIHTEVDDYGDTGHKTLNFYYIATSDSSHAVATDDAMQVEWVEIHKLQREYGFITAKNAADKLIELYNENKIIFP